MDSLLDTDTIDEVAAAVRRVYARAIEIAGPRVWARLESLVAVDDAEQTISDEEWEDLVAETEDAIGDAVVDGAVAGSITLGAAVLSGVLVARITEHLSTLAEYSPTIRAKLDRWIETTIAKEPPESLAALLEMLRSDSPLSDDKADLVAATEVQAAGNGGLHVALEAAPAAKRWVSQRDTRVRLAHALADSDTIPYDQDFNVGGYPARYPLDPQLPFELRVNCRCELAYVEGAEARRALGATKAELRAKANELDIAGRSTMNKGQLQHAVLKALCLNGLAGGPDCPDKLDQMNRAALLTLARGQGISGRHRMSRNDLLAALRGELRGTDPGRLATGYVSHTDFGRAVKRATGKRRRLPNQEGSGVLPSLGARRSARRAVFDEFEHDGQVPCVHCGLSLHWDPRQGLAMLVPEPIVPWSEGGTLDVANLLPSCPSCFRARGGRGLTASAADVPRDDHGRWTRRGGGGGAAPTITDKVKAAQADGSVVSRVDGPGEAAALTNELDDLTDLVDDPEFTDSPGTKFTRFALNDPGGIYDTQFVSRVDGMGIGGALGGYTSPADDIGNPASFFVDYVGTTGIADGVGSQLYAEAVKHAASNGLGIMGDPTANAVPFWKAMGWVEDPNGVGADRWGATPEQVKRLAAQL